MKKKPQKNNFGCGEVSPRVNMECGPEIERPNQSVFYDPNTGKVYNEDGYFIGIGKLEGNTLTVELS